MTEIKRKVSEAQQLFREKLIAMQKDGGLNRERYARFLTLQYHLTKGVQKHFFAIASLSSMARKRELRQWLVKFAQEEEFHFEIAKSDLEELGLQPGPIPLDTQMWWSHFSSILEVKPFSRLGATCILENIADGSSDIIDTLIKEQGSNLNSKSLKFLTIHRHGPNLAHGDQILEQIEKADLNAVEQDDLLAGAHTATVLYLRFAHWIVTGKELY